LSSPRLCASAGAWRADATAAAMPTMTSRRSKRPRLISSASRIRADEPVHADDVRLDALEQLPHRQALRQIERRVEREQPEVIVMHAVPFGRHGAAVAGLAEVVLARRVALNALRKLRGGRGDVVEHPMHEPV